MTEYLFYLGVAFTAGFLLTLILMPFVISAAKKFKASQNILHYVDNHSAKQGTPTMGGIAFIAAVVAASAAVFRGSALKGGVAVGVMAAYGLIGFLDDYIKIRFRRNLGLKAYQKIIFQVAVAVTVAIFVFRQKTPVLVPFTGQELDFGPFIIPFVIFIFLAVSNSVNLTDGLDGLAGGVTLVYTVVFSLIIAIVSYSSMRAGATLAEFEEMRNLSVLGFLLGGAMLAYLAFNSYPAKIFMGDTGSLALGGLLACQCVLSGLEFIMPIVGVMFVISAASVIIQVLYFKATKGKRVFLMSPYHHHLERKGLHEAKITAIYMIVTAILGAAVLTVYLLLLT